MQRGVRQSSGRIDTEGEQVGERLNAAIANGMRRNEAALRQAGARAGNRVGDGINDGIRRGSWHRDLSRTFRGFGQNLGRDFSLGIGADRMGKGIIDALVLAGPSVLSGVAAIGTAMAAELITAMSAVGPGIAGAIGVGLAGISTAVLNAGLLYAAFKLSGDTLKDVGASAKELGKELGTPIARGMLPGLEKSVKILRDALPEITDLLKETGAAFGQVAEGIAETVTSAANLGRIRGILTTNKTFVDNFGKGINGLTTSFLILFNAAKPFVDFIGEGIRRFGEWSQATLEAKEANGELATFMDGMLAKFKQLWEITKDFSAGFFNVFQAASPVGEKLLESIAGIADRFRAWTSDAGNMARMTRFFEKAHVLASKVFDMLGSIFTAGGRAFENMDIGPLMHVLDTLQNEVGPEIARIFKQIKDAVGPQLVEAFDNFAKTLKKIADSGIVGKVAGAVAGLVLAISKFLATDFGAKLAAFGLAWILFGGIISGVVKVLSSLVTALLALTAPVAIVLGIVAAVAAVFALMWTQSEKFRDAIKRLGQQLQEHLQPILDAIGPAFEDLWEAILRLGKALGDVLAPIIQFLTPLFVAFGAAISGVLLAITYVLTLLADFLTGFLTGDWQPFVDDVIAAQAQIQKWWDEFIIWLSEQWPIFTAWLGDKWEELLDWLELKWEEFRLWLGEKWTEFWTVTLPMWLAQGVAALLAYWENWKLGMSIKWEEFKTGLSEAWQLFWTETVPGWFATGVDAVIAYWDNWKLTMSTKWTEFANWLGIEWDKFWGGLPGVLYNIFIQPIFTSLNTLWTNLSNAAQGYWTSLQSWFGGIWTGIVVTFQMIFGPIIRFWVDLWSDVATAVRIIWDLVTGWLAAKWASIVALAGGLWAGIKTAIVQPVIEAYNGVVEWIGKITAAVQGGLDTIRGKLTEALSIQTQIAGTATIAPPGGSVPRGWLDLIPALAGGGIVPAIPGGMLVRVGEAGRERIDPIGRDGLTDRDRALIKLIAGQFAGNSRGDISLDVRIGDTQLDAYVDRRIDHSNSSLARRAQHTRGR